MEVSGLTTRSEATQAASPLDRRVMPLTLWHGDCLDLMAHVPDGSVDMILCDLPYGTTACKWDTVIPFDSLWAHYKRVIKPNGAIVLFGSEPFSSLLRVSNLKHYRYDWTWIKNTGTNFLHAKRMPIRYTENIHVFGLPRGTYNPQKTTGHVATNSGKGRNTGNIYHGKSKVDYKGGDTTRFPKNTIAFDTVDNYSRIHPTQKPGSLCEYLIRTYTNEGETVLDNCMGSGTTGIACLNTGRNFIGIEKDQKYFEIARNRIEGHNAEVSGEPHYETEKE